MIVVWEVCATADLAGASLAMKKDAVTMESEVASLAHVERPDMQRRCCRDTKQCDLGRVGERRNQYASFVFKGDVAAIE